MEAANATSRRCIGRHRRCDNDVVVLWWSRDNVEFDDDDRDNDRDAEQRRETSVETVAFDGYDGVR